MGEVSSTLNGSIPDTSKLTAKQEKALSILLTSPSLEHAAKELNIAPVTIHRYLKEAPFKAAYQAARREIVSHAVTRLQQACSGAVGVLCSVAADKTAPAGARVTAARTILDTAFKSIELEDLAARIEALEAVTKDKP